MTEITYRGHTLSLDDPAPGWITWSHPDYDGPPDNRRGSVPSFEAAVKAIATSIEEHGSEPVARSIEEREDAEPIRWADIQESRWRIAEVDAWSQLVAAMADLAPSRLEGVA